ncbi:MAG: lysoplasmalogenase [Bacteroidia bacterium]|nr:lysoplasmalogenase [Bacteroidia bacterium]
MSKKFTFVFFIILLTDIAALHFPELPWLRYFTKPAIVGSLIIWLALQKFELARLKQYLMAGLIFSLTGDVLLMFVRSSEYYFLFGLLVFLLAHICYILAFVRRGYFKPRHLPLGIVLVTAYAAFIYWKISDGLGENQPYVIAYMLILWLLAVTAFMRRSYVSLPSYQYVLAGALFFMFSDSLLAWDKFNQSIPFGGIAVMATYGIAQYCLIRGGKAQEE